MRFAAVAVFVAACLLQGCAIMSAPTGLPMSLSVPQAEATLAGAHGERAAATGTERSAAPKQCRTLERFAVYVQTRRCCVKNSNPEHAKNRRSFLGGSLATRAAAAGATVLGVGVHLAVAVSLAQTR
jgi:hypothetical protein